MIVYLKLQIFSTSLMVFLFLAAGELPGFSAGEKTFEKTFNLIYNQHFNEAHAELIKSKSRLETWNYQILLLDLYWWKAISSNCEDDFTALDSALREYSGDLKKTPNSDNLEELIYLSYSLRLALMKNSIFTIMVNLYKINHLVEQFETDKLTVEQQDIFEIYTALFNIGRSSLLFNNPKLREKGIKILESNLTSSNGVYQTMSCYFLSKIYFELDRLPSKAMAYCKQLCILYPDNKIFAYNLEQCRKIIKQD